MDMPKMDFSTLGIKNTQKKCKHVLGVPVYTGHVQADDYYEISCIKCGKVLKEWKE